MNPKGYFDKFLVMDAETSGIAFDSADPSFHVETQRYYQSVSWGLIVADSETLKPIDELYVEIQHDPKYLWNDGAERVHGLSREYLADKGLPEIKAVEEIGSFVFDHFGEADRVPCAGHNVSSFDIYFMRSLLTPYEIMFETGSRFIDTNSIGFACYGTYNSDDLFSLMGVNRSSHNALEDSHACLKTIRNTRMVYDSVLNS